eukprot:TRINITY_DN111163_c0_g1_i1.p1 TRINITY_DN111163_c0_g1~~TRINITY_DN111163_c0_g1_i1.p1  ORF type:complete len:351 (-),score=73.97 TRINITY_DN111163_c0_g1_i1:818-1870(-)
MFLSDFLSRAMGNAADKPLAIEDGDTALKEADEAAELADAWVPMPPPEQVWYHSVCTQEKLAAALEDEDCTAIEADILLGTLAPDAAELCGLSEKAAQRSRPIMAHPPLKTSDLSFQAFLARTLGVAEGRRHLKLDFKDLSAVEPCIAEVAANRKQLLERGQAVFFNADILPGPGRRGQQPTIGADAFLRAIAAKAPGAILSLGWSVDVKAKEAYTEMDCLNMATAYDAYVSMCAAAQKPRLPCGVVFAVSVRLAARDPVPFVGLLRQVPGSQLLLWTGTHEPPIDRTTVDWLQAYYRELGLNARVGYDVRTVPSPLRSLYADLLARITRVIVKNRSRCGNLRCWSWCGR